ncbi:MAG: hypothetical protein ABSE71_04755 [Candidatus Micrarchaeaceae archaeon]|nr:hypothetical protein [Candidatus Micrarchaeota archaeon]
MAEKTAMLGSSIVGTSSVKNYKDAKYLLIVPGHAVYVGREAASAHLDDYWIGGFKGEAKFYTEHAFAGISEAGKDEKSILIFSGGQTREKAGPFSEAQSYWALSDQHLWLTMDRVKGRATTEDFARDSLENLAFSVGRFVQLTGEMPYTIVIFGWVFKEERYRRHAEALGIEQWRLHYYGVNNPEGEALAMAKKGEIKTLADFEASPLGRVGILAQKREQRDPFLRGSGAYRYYQLEKLFPLLRFQ